jgi:biopolymer transport protein ExbD
MKGMRPPERLNHQGGRLNLTPMIDVVFLLIIFFMVSYNMTQQDNAIPVELPEAETGTLPQEKQTKQLTVSIPSPGTLYVGTEKILDKGRLRHIMTEARKDWGEETEIRIRTNKDIPQGEIKPILRMAAESGIMHVSFAVEAVSGV